MKKILLTGGTGFLGNYLVHNLVEQGHEVYILVRKQSHKKAMKKFEDLNITIILGDLENLDLIDDDKIAKKMIDDIDIIVHCAAFYDLCADYKTSFLANVVGTQNVLHFSSTCKKLKELHYISTIAVAGDYEGEFLETDLYKDQIFSNNYARTKYDAEKLFRNTNIETVNKIIYRPGIIIGDSQTGKIDHVNGPYYLLELIAKVRSIKVLGFLPIPLGKDVSFPIIPVDHAAKFIVDIINKKNTEDKTYHVISTHVPTLEEFIEVALKSCSVYAKILRTPNIFILRQLIKFLGVPPDLIDYGFSKTSFSLTHAISDSDSLKKSDSSEYLLRVLQAYFSRVKQ